MDCPSEAFPMTMSVWAWISVKVNFLQRLFSKMRVPTSSLVFVPPDIVLPLIWTTFCSPDGSAEPVKAVPTDTFSIVISLTGVDPRSMRRVFDPSTYSVGISKGTPLPTKLAAYVPESPLLKLRSARIVSFTITPPPTVLAPTSKLIAAAGFRPIMRSTL